MAFCFLRRHASGRVNWALLGALFVAATTLGGPAWAKAAGSTVRVLYPNSLKQVMQHGIAPAFEQATGYRFAGHHARSLELASQIREQALAADVLITASPQVNLKLMGSSHGDWVAWYAPFMLSPLVVGYDHQSKFADELTSRPWYQVAAEPGFRLGLTTPYKNTKGRLTAKALNRAVNNHDQHSLEAKLAANSQVVPAQDLIHRLQTHQLDAAFFYRSEAVAADIPIAPLNLGNISATYTVTVLNNAPHPDLASTFVAFLLGKKGKKILKESSGLVLTPTMPIFGNAHTVPTALKPLLGQR